MRKSLAAAFFLLCAFSATAGTITSIDPANFKVNSGEQFISVYGTGLGDTIVFDGPAGHFSVQANAVFRDRVVGWVPEAIIATSGAYNLTTVDSLGVVSGPITFKVSGFRLPLAILVPDIVREQPSSREGAYVKYDVFAIGGADANPTIKCDYQTGSLFPMGTTRVTCTASNIYGETATDSFPILVRDEVAPRLSLPAAIQVKASSVEGTYVDYKADAFDDIYGTVIPDCKPVTGSLFPVGLTTVRCSATDADGNVGVGAFSVEVLGPSSYYPLTVNVPDQIYMQARDAKGAYVKFDVSVSGTRDLSPRLTCDHLSGDNYPIGDTLVTCDALDYNGMRGQGQFFITVMDVTPPTILGLAASPSLLTADNQLYPINIDVSASDDIDLRPLCKVVDVTSKENINLQDGDDPKSYDWLITGDFSLELRAERRNTTRVYNIYVDCTDFYGNWTRGRTTVTVSGGVASGSVIEPPPPTTSKRRSAH
ncbi:MAG: HYR domain-containing protein [Acidobacteriota bacterium]|nr:HYR domain-containing protein [Acidobacteriota bacterium]